jgi:hypothetical protein
MTAPPWPSSSRVIEIAASVRDGPCLRTNLTVLDRNRDPTNSVPCRDIQGVLGPGGARLLLLSRLLRPRCTFATPAITPSARRSRSLPAPGHCAVRRALRRLECPKRAFVAAGVARPLDGESSHELAVEFAAQVVRIRSPREWGVISHGMAALIAEQGRRRRRGGWLRWTPSPRSALAPPARCGSGELGAQPVRSFRWSSGGGADGSLVSGAMRMYRSHTSGARCWRKAPLRAGLPQT